MIRIAHIRPLQGHRSAVRPTRSQHQRRRDREGATTRTTRPALLTAATAFLAVVILPLTSTLPASATPDSTASSLVPNTFAVAAPFAEAGGITLPGVVPGAPEVQVTGNSTAKQIILDNATIGMTFDIRDSRAKITRLVNKQTGESVAVTTGQFFSMTLADGTVIGDDQLSITTLPEVSALPVDSDSPNFAQRSPGTQVLSKFTVALPQGSFELTWVVELRTDANYVEQRFVVTPKTGPVSYTGLRLLDVSWPGARTEGKDDGSPVVAGGSAGSETFFAGLENPMSKPTAASGAVRISLPSATPIPVGSSILESTAIGVSVPGQMRRSFQYYVERERAHARHTFLHYQTWYDLKPPGNMINGAELTKAINLFGTQLTSRGAKIDSFWVDDGWDYLRDPRQADESNLNTWSFDPTQFPTGFTPQKQAAAGYGASMSVWMSPFGGYGGSEIRAAINASKPEAERSPLQRSLHCSCLRHDRQPGCAWFQVRWYRWRPVPDGAQPGLPLRLRGVAGAHQKDAGPPVRHLDQCDRGYLGQPVLAVVRRFDLARRE